MYKIREGACDICSKVFKTLCIDHCHITGKIRGLLCSACNIGLGKFKDKPDLLKKAAEYNREWQLFLNRPRSSKEILDFGRELAEDYGLEVHY